MRNTFEQPTNKTELSEENKEAILAEIEKFDALIELMIEKGGNPGDHVEELKNIAEAITEIDPSFEGILNDEEHGKDTDGEGKLPGQAMMDALEKYFLKSSPELKESKESTEFAQ